MNFIGRQAELRKLEKSFTSNRQETILIYGRRRVGKSELIRKALEMTAIPHLYYECRETSEMNNISSLSALISQIYGERRLAFDSMEEVLDYFFERAKTPQILVLDEYPYLRNTVKGLDSILQSLIDKYRDSSGLKLILCGSFVETMKSLILAHSPLYGRMTLTINLKPMDYYESALFYPRFSPDDRVRLYSVFGGIPYYNQLIDSSLSVRENLMNLLVEPGARLEDETTLFLQAELSKLNNANQVFETLAKGTRHFSDILEKSHISSSPTLSDVLKRLMQMELVSRKSPINDENNRKKSNYLISDNLSRFFYRYLYRYSSQRMIMAPDTFYDRYIADDFEHTFVPESFEEICAQYLIRKNRAGLMDPPFEKIGKYYYDLPGEHRNGEFDIVTLDEKGYIFYEAKFRKNPITAEMRKKEIAQVTAAGLPCYRYGFFSRSGFEGSPGEKEICITLDEMY